MLPIEKRRPVDGRNAAAWLAIGLFVARKPTHQPPPANRQQGSERK